MYLNTNPQMPERAKRVLCRPDFNFETAYKSAGAVAGLCNWVSAMVTYHNIAKFVAPKTDALLKAEKSLQVANKKLAAAMEDLAVCQGELDAMTVSAKREECMQCVQCVQSMQYVHATTIDHMDISD